MRTGRIPMDMTQSRGMFPNNTKNTLTARHIFLSVPCCQGIYYLIQTAASVIPMTFYIILSTIAITAAPSASDLASASSMELPLIP